MCWKIQIVAETLRDNEMAVKKTETRTTPPKTRLEVVLLFSFCILRVAFCVSSVKRFSVRCWMVGTDVEWWTG